jgi:hypothetical protein
MAPGRQPTSDIQFYAVQRDECDENLQEMLEHEMLILTNRVGRNVNSWRAQLSRACDSAVDDEFKAKEEMLWWKQQAASFVTDVAVPVIFPGFDSLSKLSQFGVKAMINVSLEAAKKSLASMKSDMKKQVNKNLVDYCGKMTKGGQKYIEERLKERRVPGTEMVCQAVTVDLGREVDQKFPYLTDASQLKGVQSTVRDIIYRIYDAKGIPRGMYRTTEREIAEGVREREESYREAKHGPVPMKVRPLETR